MRCFISFVLVFISCVLVRGQGVTMPISPFEAIPAAAKQLREAPSKEALLVQYEQFSRDFPIDKFRSVGFLLDQVYAAMGTKLMAWKDPKTLSYLVQIGSHSMRWALMQNMDQGYWKEAENIHLVDSIALLMNTSREKEERLTLLNTELLYHTKGSKDAFGFLVDADPTFKWKLKHPDLYVALFRASARPNDALDIVASRVKSGFADAGTSTLLRTIWLETGRSEAAYSAYYASLIADVRQKKAADLSSKEVNYPAASFTVKRLDGRKLELSDLKGKVVVLDFWATWCGPCIASFDSMKDLVHQYKDSADVVFLFVNTMEKESNHREDKVRSFLKEKSIDLPVVFDNQHEGSYEVLSKYKVGAIPAQFIIDKNGQVRYATKGYDGSSDGFKEEMRLMIERAASF